VESDKTYIAQDLKLLAYLGADISVIRMQLSERRLVRIHVREQKGR
jgi:hypothetical protein